MLKWLHLPAEIHESTDAVGSGGCLNSNVAESVKQLTAPVDATTAAAELLPDIQRLEGRSWRGR